MAVHELPASETTVHAGYLAARPPVLTVEPGDEVIFSTLDAGWGAWQELPEDFRQDVVSVPMPGPPAPKGPALTGPVAVRGAVPGSYLSAELLEVAPGSWGFCPAGGWSTETNDYLRLAAREDHVYVGWRIDAAAGLAESTTGLRLPVAPFPGTIGLPRATEEQLDPVHPQRTGGNLDCPALVQGSILYLPVEVEGGLCSVGDGHARQGNGEVSGLGLECPLARLRVRFGVKRPPKWLDFPLARAPRGWITFGFSPDLNEAALQALEAMHRLLHHAAGLPRAEALSLASLAADLEIAQIVNGVKAVYAIYDPDLVGGVEMADFWEA